MESARQVQIQKILLDEAETCLAAPSFFQCPGKGGVDFDGGDGGAFFKENLGENAASGSDFEDGISGDNAQSPRDFSGDLGTDKKILAIAGSQNWWRRLLPGGREILLAAVLVLDDAGQRGDVVAFFKPHHAHALRVAGNDADVPAR